MNVADGSLQPFAHRLGVPRAEQPAAALAHLLRLNPRGTGELQQVVARHGCPCGRFLGLGEGEGEESVTSLIDIRG